MPSSPLHRQHRPASANATSDASHILLSRELPYAEWSHTLALFAPFSGQPWSMLLDSAGSEHVNSRYDILLRQPCTVLCGRVADFAGNDPFTQLQQILASFPQYQGSHQLPFCGGAAGYFGYDAGRLIEHITPAHRAQTTAVAAAPTHADDTPQAAADDLLMPDIALGFYQHALIIDHQLRRCYVLAPQGELDDATIDAFWRPQSRQGEADFYLSSSWQSNMSKTQYMQKIQQIHDHLDAGDCYQINLAQRFAAPYQGDEWVAYKALRQANKAPFSAFIKLAEGTVISVSPERFLQTDASGKVQTKPIKGTSPRHPDPEQDAKARDALLQSPKDQAENLMIVDLLRNDLSRVCLPGSVKVPELFAIESFAAVHHLVSTIEGQLAKPTDSVALLKAAFPGGSITGAPKVSAMQIIESLEPHRRSVYCGSIGYINQNGSSDTNIAIRTLVATEQHMYCWAGGGIVTDSEAESEYQETFDKVKQILPVLADLNSNIVPLPGSTVPSTSGSQHHD